MFYCLHLYLSPFLPPFLPFHILHESGELKPTLLKLKTMTTGNGIPLRIVQNIAVGDYMTFGLLLLQDENGDKVETIKKIHMYDGKESIITEILRRWLTIMSPTCTYEHLIECLRQSGFDSLALDIFETVTEGTVLEALSGHFCIGYV